MFMVCAFCSCMCFVSDYVFILVSLLMSDQQDLKIDQLPFVAESLSQLDLQVAAGSVEISKKNGRLKTGIARYGIRLLSLP